MATDKTEVTTLVDEIENTENSENAVSVDLDPIFGPLPNEVILLSANEFLELSTIASLSASCRRYQGLFQSTLDKAKLAIPLLTDVVEGNRDGVVAKITAQPDLLFQRSTVTDDAGQTFYDVSALKLIFFFCDADMFAHVAPLIPAEKKQDVIKQYDEIQDSGADLVKIDKDHGTWTLTDIEALLENEDSIIYNRSRLYYVNKKTRELNEIAPTLLSSAEQRVAFISLCNSFENMDVNFSRRSLREEYRLIADIFGVQLKRRGVHYSREGRHYCGSTDEFALIAAYHKLFNLPEPRVVYNPYACQAGQAASAMAKAQDRFWKNDVGKAQQRQPAWLLKRFCEFGRPFVGELDFDNPPFDRGHNTFLRYSTDEELPVFPRRTNGLGDGYALTKALDEVGQPLRRPLALESFVAEMASSDSIAVQQLVDSGKLAMSDYINLVRREVEEVQGNAIALS